MGSIFWFFMGLLLFVIYKLYSNFGKIKIITVSSITPEERKKIDQIFKGLGENLEKPLSITHKKKEAKTLTNLKELVEKFPDFSLDLFVPHINILFDKIFLCFAKSNIEFLKESANKKLYNAFIEQIQKREINNLKQELEIKHVYTTIDKIQMLTTKAKVFVSFRVSQMSAIVNTDGVSFDNPKKLYRDIVHKWVFERNFIEQNTWILAKTSSVEV